MLEKFNVQLSVVLILVMGFLFLRKRADDNLVLSILACVRKYPFQ